ncbi:hypothetical protein PTTG_06097 [Puccinia triticina 1-1 BBBD Race 1]|uniref:hAT-like transposase RNase-H fold domain-containing protein n=1 Tax=Puccinia triticina (isolate 1-1 / race 1 (BBBD)) TaxID=630390 RepID=A0A0C4EZ42_PUCT1|nr:hypothetical protein PTTG_06097 [Puccinia triticina 1-1 BBBD Race 1]
MQMHLIYRCDWEIAKKLNDVAEFYFITKKMEADTLSACLMLAKYQYIKEIIKKKQSAPKPEFQAMFNKMASKTETYLCEALDCDVILLAKVLNPAYRLSMFQAWFLSHHDTPSH